MKNYYFFIISVLLSSFLTAQGNFEQSLMEKEAFKARTTQKSTLETDYVPTYYRLDFNSDPNTTGFSGTTTMHFTTSIATNQIKINAKENLDITSVEFHSSPITNYSRVGDVLTITLPETLDAGVSDVISISFSGNADTSSGYYTNTHNGTAVSYTLSESFHASSWWVCKDDLQNKVDGMDIFITHPSDMKAASNGTLISVEDLGNGSSVTHWQHNYGIPAYLAAVAVTNYVEYNTTMEVGGVTMPIINYLYPESLSSAKTTLDATPNYITEISNMYGDYPFKNEKYGHAQWNWGGGMEHSTMSFMGGWSARLIKHELAHQWFGDKVTCRTWRDIWLNEGFAEYTDGWLIQKLNGESSFISWKNSYVNFITSSTDGSVYNPEPENEDRIFNYRLTYVKGSMMVHLIRYMINDDDVFFQAMRDFLDNPNYAYGFATTEDLKSSLETSTGMDWTQYFADWIYGEGHPIFDIKVDNIGSGKVSITVTQTSSNSSVSFFETPFEIEFKGANGETETRRFNLTENNQVFSIVGLSFDVVSYTFNPKYDVVCKVNSQTLGSQEIEVSNNKPLVYPNPAKGYFFAENDSSIDEIKVFDFNGKLIFNQAQVNQRKLQVTTSGWAKGVYIVQIKSGEDVKLNKLIVE